jgi:hypothetical protein
MRYSGYSQTTGTPYCPKIARGHQVGSGQDGADNDVHPTPRAFVRRVITLQAQQTPSNRHSRAGAFARARPERPSRSTFGADLRSRTRSTRYASNLFSDKHRVDSQGFLIARQKSPCLGTIASLVESEEGGLSTKRLPLISLQAFGFKLFYYLWIPPLPADPYQALI